MNFSDIFNSSLLHIAPILVAAAFAIAIVVERYKALFKTYHLKDSQGFFDKVHDLVAEGKVSDGVAFCDRYSEKPIARIVKSALLRSHQPESLIEHGLQISVADATASVQKRTTFLATIANVATLMGLFGTILGLIHSFEAVGHADPQQKSALLAAGISQAMNATMLGLGVAIPCMIAFSFLMNRTNRMVAEMESAAIRVLDILKQRYYSTDEQVFHAPSSADEDPRPSAQISRLPRRSA